MDSKALTPALSQKAREKSASTSKVFDAAARLTQAAGIAPLEPEGPEKFRQFEVRLRASAVPNTPHPVPLPKGE